MGIKHIEYSKIPENWEVVKLDNQKFFKIIKSGIRRFDGKKLYLSTKCIKKNKIVKIEAEVTFSKRPSRANMEPVLNSVWFAKMKNTIKVYSFTQKNLEELNKYIMSTGFCGIKCKEKVCSNYLKQFFLSLFFNKIKDSLVTGSTQQDIKQNSIVRIKIPLPSLEEQKAIAKILSTVDTIIKNVDEAIKKTERLKKGLMQELLTKGIGHERFKDTKIGEMPEEWEVTKLGNHMNLKSGLYFKFSEFRSNGTRCLKIDNVGFGEIVWDTVTYLPDDYLNKYQELVLKKGDIVIALNRPLINNKLKVGILNEKDSPSILYQRVGKIIFEEESTIRNDYLFFLLTGHYFKNQLSRCLIGTDQPYIRTPILLKIKIPLPPLSEQKKMAEILNTIDKKLELERKRKEKLRRVKKGLMNDLLTGRKRVKVVV